MHKGRRGGTTKAIGDAQESRALDLLLREGLSLVRRNYRVARGPFARGGEVDLIMRDPEGTLVFVEVRSRRDARFGGAAASVSPAKRQSILFAARCFLRALTVTPPCRFDVVVLEAERIDWIKAAFDATRD